MNEAGGRKEKEKNISIYPLCLSVVHVTSRLEFSFVNDLTGSCFICPVFPQCVVSVEVLPVR